MGVTFPSAKKASGVLIYDFVELDDLWAVACKQP